MSIATDRTEWVWMPHPAHLIVARDCRFHLATFVPIELPDGIIIPRVSIGVIVSTVGEYLPDYQVRELLAQRRGISLNGNGDDRLHDWIQKCGYEDIGAGRKYETMVFPAAKNEDPESQCCPFQADHFAEIGFHGYNDAPAAYRGHIDICRLWAGKSAITQTQGAVSV